MKIPVKCLCKAGTFVCDIRPSENGYFWTIEDNGRTFAGFSETQQEAISKALEAIK